MAATAQQPPPKSLAAKFAPDRVLVAFKGAVKQQARLAAVSRSGLQVDTAFQSDYVVRLKIPPQQLASGLDVKKAVAQLKADPTVRVAEPDWVIHGTDIPNDPLFGDQWALHNIGQTGGTEDADIDAPEAWDVTDGSPTIKVAVIDSGTDYTHPDLSANILRDTKGKVVGYDFVNLDADPMDDHGHGTHIAGTIGAVGNNGIGTSGVCHTVKIIPIKLLDSSNQGYTSDAIRSVDLARMLGAKIINASWGGFPNSQLLLESILRSRDKGILFVAAAGNNGESNDNIDFFPASFGRQADNMVVVAATNHNDELTSWSNFGSKTVDIAAPGDLILSTVPGEMYEYWSGTSMATPHVVGTAALVLSKYPTLKYWQVKARLMGNVDQPSGVFGRVRSGRLNAANALVVDTVAPSAPTLFGASQRAHSALRMQWKAGGDDKNVGQATAYDLRFSTSPITATSFLNATRISSVPTPAPIGTVQSLILPGLSPATTYYFALRAIDNGGNVSPIAYSAVTTLGDVIALQDGAEGTPYFSGWPTTTSDFHSGTACYTDSPDGIYLPNQDVSLSSEPVTVSSNNDMLKFWARYEVEKGWDNVYLDVSTDDWASFTTLATFTGVDGWNEHSFSLQAFAGQTIRIRFRLVTDFSVEFDGFYVDDILISNRGPLTMLLEDNAEGAGLFVGDVPWTLTTEAFFSPWHSYTDSEGASYASNMDTSLVQGTSAYMPLDLVPTLSFWVMYDLEWGYDFLNVEVSSDDGANWVAVGRLTGTSDGFTHVELPLTTFIGENVKVRFRFLSDYLFEQDGVHVDDIQIVGGQFIDYHLTKLSADVRSALAGSTVPFKAKLKRADTSVALAGEQVDFYDAATNTLLGSATTDTTGAATITLTAPAEGIKQIITAKFAGDINFAPSSANGSITGTKK